MATPRAPTEKEAHFFITIMQCMTNKPEVDWDMVAEKTGYSNALSAKVRFRQIKKAVGFKDDGSSSNTPTPTKGRAKKDATTVGSGTNTTPSKVTKPRAPRKPKAAKVKSGPEQKQEKENEVDEEDELAVQGDIEESPEDEADACTFGNALHEQLYKNHEEEYHDCQEKNGDAN